MGDSPKDTDDGENVLQDQTLMISNEMDVSPKDSGSSKGVLQDQSPISGTNPTAHENQELSSVRQESAENQQFHSGTCTDMFPRLGISSSQVLNIVQLDEPLTRSDGFYSSRKLRIGTKCSRLVDALLLPQPNPFRDQSGEAGRNPATLGNQVLPSVRPDPSANQQLPPDVSIEMSAVPSEIAISSSSQYMNIDLLDEPFSGTGAFYSSRELQIRTNCSLRVDALLSPRQHSKDFLVTAFDSKTRDGQKTANSSPQKRGVKANRGPTPIKRRKTLESDSNKLKSGKKSLIPKLQPMTSLTTPPKPSNEKIVGSYYRDPKTGNVASKSKLSFSISAANIDESPINLRTQKSEVASQNVGESKSANQVERALSFQDCPRAVSSESPERISSANDSHQTRSLIHKIFAELDGVRRSKISTDTSTTSINKSVNKQRKKNRATQTLIEDLYPPSMSDHQCPIAGGSSTGHRFESPLDNKESREAECTVNQSISSDDMVLKYVLKARENLVSIWQETLECKEEEELFFLFVKNLSFSSHPVNRSYLETLLLTFLQNRAVKWDEENVFTDREKTLEYHAYDAYDVFIRIIVTALRSTVSDSSHRDYDSIIRNYESFKLLHEKCSEFWKPTNEENIQDEASKNYVKALREKMQRLMLETKTAFQDLLMHVGENAEQSQIDKYVEKVWEEDKKFLRLNCF